MNITEYLTDGQYILPDHPKFQYCGRIGRGRNGMPEFVFPCTFVKWRFKGNNLCIIVGSERFYQDIYAGCIIDGKQYRMMLNTDGNGHSKDGYALERICLMKDGKVLCEPCEGYTDEKAYTSGQSGDDAIHEITFFKRQDAMNIIEFCGIIYDKDAELLECEPLPELKMEVYGDSVSAGEVSEAVDRVAGPDPENHEGRYSNSWYSYSWMTARKLNAQLHDIAQGGIALLDRTGWFSWPDFIGMESVYDKVRYYPDIKNATKWDFTKYIPDIVVIAFGQNDANPDDYMKRLREGGEPEAARKAQNWKEHYRAFVLKLRELYPKALIVCTTTILNHDPSWDDAIEEVVGSLNDLRVKHFLYTGNGCGTPGHIRIPEADKMSDELAGFIRENLQ